MRTSYRTDPISSRSEHYIRLLCLLTNNKRGKIPEDAIENLSVVWGVWCCNIRHARTEMSVVPSFDDFDTRLHFADDDLDFDQLDTSHTNLTNCKAVSKFRRKPAAFSSPSRTERIHTKSSARKSRMFRHAGGAILDVLISLEYSLPMPVLTCLHL